MKLRLAMKVLSGCDLREKHRGSTMARARRRWNREMRNCRRVVRRKVKAGLMVDG